MTDGETIAEVVVEHAGGDAYRYEFDRRRERLRLVGVVAGESLPVDLGVVGSAMAADGGPLRVFILGTAPIPPGTLVDIRPVALVELADGTGSAVGHLVGVPVADPARQTVRDLVDLAPSVRAAIEQWIHTAHVCRVAVRWQPAADAVAELKAAIRRAAIARTEARKGRILSGWQAAEAPSPASETTATDPHTAAERTIALLPARFQRYVPDCLLPDERILLFVTRPPLTIGEGFLRRRRLNEGLLVVTDRQVLWLMDALPPDSTYVDWGYVAVTTAVERIAAAALVQAGDRAVLELGVGGRDALERWQIDFPADRAPLLDQAVQQLRRWIPGQTPRAIRRIARLRPPRPAEVGDPVVRDLLAAADAVIPPLLESAETRIAHAVAPPWPPKGLGARLVAVTDRRVVIAPLGDEAGASLQTYPLGAVASVTLRHALVGCALELAIPTPTRVERLVVDFESPAAGPFLGVFAALRQLLALPSAADGEPLHVRIDEEAA